MTARRSLRCGKSWFPIPALGLPKPMSGANAPHSQWFHKASKLQMIRLIITNRRGLHAQACARIVNIAKHCRCKLSIVGRHRRVNARNIVAVMLLTAAMGTTVRIEADGPDEAVVMREIAALFHDGLGERS